MTNKENCNHCEEKGYIEIRDCSGEIQRFETCSFCDGTGYKEEESRKIESDRMIYYPKLDY